MAKLKIPEIDKKKQNSELKKTSIEKKLKSELMKKMKSHYLMSKNSQQKQKHMNYKKLLNRLN